jgi:hypothetical protein
MQSHPRRQANLKRLLEQGRRFWDHAGVRRDARASIARALQCRTEALGAEVFSSSTGETRTIYHTCKSRACTSCGYWQTIRWQREVASQLPEIPYAVIILTMPDKFWGIFRRNRHLLHALPAIGAGVLSDWARESYQAEVPVVSVLHTFNPKLEFNPHLHMLVGLKSLHLDGNRVVKGIYFSADLLQRRWRHAVLDLLEKAALRGQLQTSLNQGRLLEEIDEQRNLLWIAIVDYSQDKRKILSYIARYLRRPPMADYRIIDFNANRVRFRYMDKKDENREHELEISMTEFVTRFIDQTPDRYQHSVRYFGLLAPRAKSVRFLAFLRLLGLPRPRRVRRMSFAYSLRRLFGFNPLEDSKGNRMKWSHRLAPKPKLATRAP